MKAVVIHENDATKRKLNCQFLSDCGHPSIGGHPELGGGGYKIGGGRGGCIFLPFARKYS